MVGIGRLSLITALKPVHLLPPVAHYLLQPLLFIITLAVRNDVLALPPLQVQDIVPNIILILLEVLLTVPATLHQPVT